MVTLLKATTRRNRSETGHNSWHSRSSRWIASCLGFRDPRPDDEQSNPWISKAQEDAAQPDSKKEIPVLSTYYAGDIEFIGELMPANVSIDQVKGKLSGTWKLNLEDQGSFKELSHPMARSRLS